VERKERTVVKWLAGNDTGISSRSLAFEFLGERAHDIDAPADPSDLGRCLRLIALVPEIRACVDSLGAKHPRWKHAAENWDRWAESMADEVGIDWSKGHIATKTYRLMTGAAP
jgi:hypothetical protein